MTIERKRGRVGSVENLVETQHEHNVVGDGHQEKLTALAPVISAVHRCAQAAFEH